MQIIKDQQLIDNIWNFADDDSVITDPDNVTVSLARWLEQHEQLLKRTGKTGVRLVPGNDVKALSETLATLDLIELDFPVFVDGRLFSVARLLRSRYNYQGEIRAVGRYLADQVFYLHRVGVNSFQFNDEKQLQLALSCFSDFSVSYQPSSN